MLLLESYAKKRILLLFAMFFAGCYFPPEEAKSIREQLQAQISKGQVYVNHSSNEISYVIKNSEFTSRPDAEKEKLIDSVEKEILAILSNHGNYKQIKIYFLGMGTRGIDTPYSCALTYTACRQKKDPV